MKSQATIFDGVFIPMDKESDRLLLNKVREPLKTSVTRGVAEIYDGVERVFTEVKTLLPHINDYELITELPRLQEYMRKIKEVGVVAIDTETDGLDPITDDIAGISIYTKGENPAYIPIRHEYFEHNVDRAIVRGFLQALVRDKIKIIMHNASFDIRVLKNALGVRVQAHFDTKLGAKMLNENEDAGLKDLWPKYVLKGKSNYSFSELFDGIKFSVMEPDKVFIYAALDALMTYELWEFQSPYLDKDNPKCIEQDLVGASDVFYNIEMPVVDAVVDMEENGLSIDLEYAGELRKKYEKMLWEQEEIVLQEFQRLAPIWRKNLSSKELSKLSDPINLGSPQQLMLILFDGLGMSIKPGVLKKGATRGTSKEAVDYLKEHYPDYSVMLEALAEHKTLSKLVSAFLIQLPKSINPKTGRIHTSWNQQGAATGRFSSSGPNLQQIPSKNKDIRPMFVPKKGNVFIGSDYS